MHLIQFLKVTYALVLTKQWNAELQKRMPENGDLSGLSLGEHIFNSLLKYLWLVSSTLTQFGGFLSLI